MLDISGVDLIGSDTTVPLVQGGQIRYADLDSAASTPPLRTVERAVREFMPWYSSVHRGAGFKSLASTLAYESAREDVRRFVRAESTDYVIFTRNTTDGINLVARALPAETTVIVSAMEHHANLLPWRRLRVEHLPVPRSAAEALELLETALRTGRDTRRIVAVTGASNVTGELWPVAESADLARRYGALILIDAAQLAPHHPVRFEDWDIDFLAFSGHKLYAPYGAGVLVARADLLRGAEPYLAGGGAVRFVGLDVVDWKDDVERHEAGSPNVVGAIALGVACRTLDAVGLETLISRERDLKEYARSELAGMPGLQLYTTWPWDAPRIGLVAFALDGYNHHLLATILSAEHGIGTRSGCFCAHPLVLHLLDVGEERAEAVRDQLSRGDIVSAPGLVRASFGVGTRMSDVRRLAEALRAIAENGPKWSYEAEPGGFRPVPETRSAPTGTWSAGPIGRVTEGAVR